MALARERGERNDKREQIVSALSLSQPHNSRFDEQVHGKFMSILRKDV